MNSLLIVVAVIFFVLIALMALLKGKARTSAGKVDQYYLRKTLFTPAERSFLGVLDSVVPAGVRVFGKVRLDDIFGVKAGLDRSQRTTAQNKVRAKHVDFLLVRASDLTPLAGIELDDSSHAEEKRQQRDQFVGAVFASGGLPLLHWPAQKAYNPAELHSALAATFKL